MFALLQLASFTVLTYSAFNMFKSWTSVAQLLMLLVCVVPWGCSRPDGAPAGACATLSPNANAHGADPQTTEVPYLIVFDDGLTSDGELSYVPGESYTCEFPNLHMLVLGQEGIKFQ